MTMLYPVRPPRRARPAPAARPAPGHDPAIPGHDLPPAQVPRAWGWTVADSGRAAHVTAAPEYQATTTQICGLYPYVAGSGTPAVGTPGRAAPAVGRGRLPRPAGLAAGRPDHQSRRVRARPARRR